MTSGIATIHLRPQRKKLTVLGMGRTDRGQKYIKKSIALESPKIADPNFKKDLATAIEQLFA